MNIDRFRFRVPYFKADKFVGYIYRALVYNHIEWVKDDLADWVLKSDALTPRLNEQCTGIKDKNGNLIYEGDILRMESPEGYLLNYTVEWSEIECGFTITGLGQTRALNVFDGDESEIIGNIHTTNKDK